mgnify:CR=1 FL=1
MSVLRFPCPIVDKIVLKVNKKKSTSNILAYFLLPDVLERERGRKSRRRLLNSHIVKNSGAAMCRGLVKLICVVVKRSCSVWLFK